MGPPGVAWLLTVALAYAGVLWMNVLHKAQGAHENRELPLLVHWLRDGTLALPIVFVAVWGACCCAAGSWTAAPLGRGPSRGRRSWR